MPAGILGEPRIPEHFSHGTVLRECFRHEGLNALLAGVGGQVLQEERAQPPALVGVADHERDLGFGRAGWKAVVAGHAHDVAL